MGSYIGIGLVYNIDLQNRIELELKNIANYLVSHEGRITNFKYSKDEEGIEWVEKSFISNLEIERIYNKISNNYFGEIEVEVSILSIEKLKIRIAVRKVDNYYFGILLDILEEELIGVGSKKKLNTITNNIVLLLEELYVVSNYDYAFCDNEAEIQYSPHEFQSLNKKVYSIVALPIREEKKVRIEKSNWNIDGLTDRIMTGKKNDAF